MLLEKISNIITKNECQLLSEYIEQATDLNDESNMVYYKNSRGRSDLPLTMQYIDRLTEVVRQYYDQPLKFSNTYSRIYTNGSYLKIHTDRIGLDITISLCIKREAKMLWPLCISHIQHEGNWRMDGDLEKYQKLYTAVELDEGEGGLMEGILYPHWRDDLVCDPNEKNIYIFYHWTKIT